MVLSDGSEVKTVSECVLLTFNECCEAIISDQDSPALNWCVNYAKEGRKMTDKMERKIQALYILNNMTRWRGPTAKCVRESLKQFVARGGIDSI